MLQHHGAHQARHETVYPSKAAQNPPLRSAMVDTRVLRVDLSTLRSWPGSACVRTQGTSPAASTKLLVVQPHCARRPQSLRCMKPSRRLASGRMRDREWWSTAKRAAGEARNSETPVLTDASGATHTSNREKAETFGQHFSSKCSLGDQDFLN